MGQNSHINPIEIWGGVECTYARIRDKVHDQLRKSRHESRLSDLDLFADLGIKKIRYPLIWEKYEKNKKGFISLHQKRLEYLKNISIEPIVGLLHHGSGPVFTDLSDPGFPSMLADYAFEIAKKFPWIKFFNPVNEPLTTARFSGLYGTWYPHCRSDAAFTKILLNELKGIVLSMQAIKSIIPEAELIPTEDLCKIHSTKKLSYQAEFENHRRWLTYDILTGRLDKEHPLWKYFIRSGIKTKELEFFQENKIIPAVCGYNYYVIGERFLDENYSNYPRRYHGGNAFHKYADIEVVRVNDAEPTGFHGLLKEAWERYRLPMALTEVHLAGTREEQLRWFYEAYSTAKNLKNEGIDFRAITSWAFLGSYDWDSLLKKKANYYESGAYDMRSGKPRPTALAGMIKILNSGQEYKNSLLQIPGWWKRDIRKIYSRDEFTNEENLNFGTVSPVLIIGKGSLGKAFEKVCKVRGIVHELAGREVVDITSREAILSVIQEKKPWAIINAAGFTRIDEAENMPQLCFRENTLGATVLAEICALENVKLLSFSSDQVFNGEKKIPYTENDFTSPLNVYGESKKMAEESILKLNHKALIIRSGSFFNPWQDNDPLIQILFSARFNQSYFLPSDIIVSPTYIPHLVNAALDLLIDDESGIWHLSSQDEISIYDFNKLALNIGDIHDVNLVSVESKDLHYRALRPKYSVLMSSQGISLPGLEKSLISYFNEIVSDKKTA